MLKDRRVQKALGIVLGIQIAEVIAAFLGWIPWSAAAFSVPIFIVFFAIPPKFLRKNVYTLSVGFRIAVGTVLVPLVASVLNLGQYLGWLALVWLIASVVAGITVASTQCQEAGRRRPDRSACKQVYDASSLSFLATPSGKLSPTSRTSSVIPEIAAFLTIVVPFHEPCDLHHYTS